MDAVDANNVFSYFPENVPIFREVGSDRAHYTEVTRQEGDIWREGLLCDILRAIFQFDELLRSRWDEAMAKGVFRYGLADMSTRTIPGTFRFVAQVNTVPTILHHT